MCKSHFSEAQIVQILAEYDAGASMRLWRSKYHGMNASDLARLKQLEAENAQMQRISARQTVKLDAMEDLIRKNSWGRAKVFRSENPVPTSKHSDDRRWRNQATRRSAMQSACCARPSLRKSIRITDAGSSMAITSAKPRTKTST